MHPKRERPTVQRAERAPNGEAWRGSRSRCRGAASTGESALARARWRDLSATQKTRGHATTPAARVRPGRGDPPRSLCDFSVGETVSGHARDARLAQRASQDLCRTHMMRTIDAVAETRTQRVHLRVAAGDDELFRSAAAAADESLSQFLVESGRERAERVLADRTRFVLSPVEWRDFTAALDRPAREIPALVELFRRSRPE